MTSTIKVDNIQKQSDGTNIIKKCGSTVTIGSGPSNPIVVCGSTVTLGRCGGSVALAPGASQTGFGRTGTVDWCTTAKTSPFNAVSGDGFFINTSGGAVTATLPSSPSAGDIVAFKDYAGTFCASCKAFTIGRGGSKLNGSCADSIRNTKNESLTLIYVDGTKGWVPVEEGTGFIGESFLCATGGNVVVTSGNFKTHIFTGDGDFVVNSAASGAPNNVVDYLVVAGGGGGGSNNYGPPRGSGGGGAGGMRFFSTAPGSNHPINNSGASPNTTITVSAQTYPVVVGAFGAGAPSGSPDSGSKGNNSSFSTVTSAGGGGGGGHCNMACRDGGSGAGARNAVCGGSGNTPPVAPPQGNDGGDGGASSGNYRGSGGGGAGGAGTDGDTSSPDYGAGGVGAYIADPFIGPTAPSYGTPGPEGSTRYFAGGGSGSPGPGSTVNAPPGGGGGAKGATGTTNTGGGGGANSPGSGANGGSGIVMIRYKFQ